LRHLPIAPWGLAAVALTLAACQGTPPTEAVPPGPAAVQPAAVAFTQVQGLVMAPSNVIAAGAANLRTLAAGDAPVVGAEVFLADAAGQRLSAFGSTHTDAQGRYSFPQVPRGFTFTVVVRVRDAQGRPVSMETLLTTHGDTNQANVSLGTTLAAALLTDGRAGSMGNLAPEKFQALVTHIEAKLNLPAETDLSLPAVVLNMALAIVSLDPTVQGLVAELKTAIADVKAPLDTLPSAQPTAAPTTAPTEAPGAAPTAVPTAAPTTSVDGVPSGSSSGGSSGGYPAPTLTLGATNHVSVATGLAITVQHAAAAPNVRTIETVQVRVTSISEPDGELVTLTETGEATGQFQGTVPFERLYSDLGTLATTAGTGKIAVNAEGSVASEVVTVSYLTLSATTTYEEPSSTLTGIVTVGGTPKAFAQVQVHDAAGALVAKTASRTDGTYAFHDLAAGTYTVVISVNGAVTKTTSVTIAPTS
jgi:hypothetical protein